MMNDATKWVRRAPLGPLVALVSLWITFSVISPGFASSDTVFSVMQAFAFIALITAGVAVVMICGELDLSIGSAAAVSGIVAVQLSGLGIWGGILVATLVMTLFGTIQGMCIAFLRINSLVFTIGSLFALRGVANIVTDGGAVLLPFEHFDASDALIQRLGILSPISIATLIILGVLAVFLTSTRWGRELFSIGGARRESEAAGVPQRRPLIIAFALSGATAGLAGALSSIVAGSGSSRAFNDVLLLAVTAALVGGVGLYGGHGSMLNVALGCLVLQTLVAGMNHLGVSRSIQDFATGGLLLVVIVIAVDWRQLVSPLRRRNRNSPHGMPAIP